MSDELRAFVDSEVPAELYEEDASSISEQELEEFEEDTAKIIESLEPPPSDEPEALSANEIPSPESSPTAPEPEEPHLTSLVCPCCLELNLTQKSTERCARCGRPFCFHFSSNIDVQYCVNCMSSISVTKQIITKTYEHRDQETGQVSFYRRRAREIKIEGLDWLFSQRKIAQLSDDELDLAIEYHRNILMLMIAEQEQRRTAYMHRNAGKQFKIPTPATTSVSTSTSTTVKKSKTVSKEKKTEQVAALLSAMKAKGIDINSLAAMLGKK